MQNLKALETLKHKWIAGNVIYDEDTDRHTRYLKYDDRLIEEAIKELEALQNRSCDNCKKRPSPFSECPCWSYSFGKSNISLCSEWESK